MLYDQKLTEYNKDLQLSVVSLNQKIEICDNYTNTCINQKCFIDRKNTFTSLATVHAFILIKRYFYSSEIALLYETLV